MPFKVIVAGSSYFNDYKLLCTKLDKILANKTDIEFFCGLCKGADLLGEQYALEHSYKVRYFPADWKKHGISAGPIRNKEMAKYADACVVFWDGISKGTGWMIKFAKDANLLLRVIMFENEKTIILRGKLDAQKAVSAQQ